MKHTLLFLSLLAFTACTSQKQEAPQSKSLILYYSQTNSTRQVAELLQQKTGAVIDSIVAVEPYAGDFGQTIARCQKEFADSVSPAIQPLTRNVADFDTIYIGYPVWFGTYAQPIAGLLKQVDLSGKVIIPFCTFGSGGLNTSSDQLKAKLPQSTFVPGYGVRQARVSAASKELDQYLINIGVLPGEATPCIDFSEPQELSEAEKQLFQEACGSYPMPLGTPVKFSYRSHPEGIEYAFDVESTSPTGEPALARILVTVSDGKKPEFTQVIR